MGYRKVLNFEITDSLCTAFLCIYNDTEKTTEFKEIFKFRNKPVVFNNHKYCDILSIFRNVKKGMSKTSEELGGSPDSISISAYGIEFGLIDKYGYLIQNPISYDDNQTEKTVDRILRFIKKSDFFNAIGSDIYEYSSVVHLMAENDTRPYILENTDTLLMLPDLIYFMLTGEKFAEYTNAYSSQLVGFENHDWSGKLISTLGFKRNIFPKIIDNGVFEILPEIRRETGCLSAKLKVSGSFLSDTSVILEKYPDSVIINNGKQTDICFCVEKPLLSKSAYDFGIKNAPVRNNKFFTMHKENGINLIDNTMKCFTERNISCSYSKLENTALASEPLKCFINPDDEIFCETDNIPIAIQNYCENTGQYVPQNVSEMMRCIYESIAFRYAVSIEKMSVLTGKSYSSICMTGRDSRNEIICRTLADVCGVDVVSGIEKSNVYGNFILQLEEFTYPENAVNGVIPDDKFIIYSPSENRENTLEMYRNFCMRI